ncbi:hypothetical protein MC885_018026 [Smutsia gigantea]|nr:hypothetical protein MC885_018026 [Smutsia gigantea]
MTPPRVQAKSSVRPRLRGGGREEVERPGDWDNGEPEPGAGGAHPSPRLRRLRDHLVRHGASGSGRKSHRLLRIRVWREGLLRFPSLPRMVSTPPSPATLHPKQRIYG